MRYPISHAIGLPEATLCRRGIASITRQREAPGD